MALVCPAAKTRNETYRRAATLKSHSIHARLYRLSVRHLSRTAPVVEEQSYLQEEPNEGEVGVAL